MITKSIWSNGLAKVVAGSMALVGMLAGGANAQSPAPPLIDPLTQPKFVNPLLIPPVAAPTTPGGTHYVLPVKTAQIWTGLINPVTGAKLNTPVFGYAGKVPGPTIVATRNVPITAEFPNQLVSPVTGKKMVHYLPVDMSLMMANKAGYPADGVPIVTHNHGAHVESASDGLPDQWFTPGYAKVGPEFVSPIMTYPNDQESSLNWYHDHALGFTRLNTHMGMFGGYLILDENELALNLPAGARRIPLIIQDRMFTATGRFFMPADPPVPTTPGVLPAAAPSILPEFYGDHILVNGRIWPVLTVNPVRYRFMGLNGSDSRFYNVWLENQTTPGGVVPTMYMIGTDGGLLAAPVAVTSWLLAPGERNDFIVDFKAFKGQTFILRNDAACPYPDGDPILPGDPTEQVMMIKVRGNNVPDRTSDPSLPGFVLRPAVPMAPIDLGAVTVTRDLAAYEMMDGFDRMMPMLGTTAGPLMFHDPITENPELGATEIWKISNTTVDAHPIHLHLVRFRVIDYQQFDTAEWAATGAIVPIGDPVPPSPDKDGWRDTAVILPGWTARYYTQPFDMPGKFVWHCHILSHEEYDMMRPFWVGPGMPGGGDIHSSMVMKAARTPFALAQNAPNPFNPTTAIRFSLPEAGAVSLAVYSTGGQLIRTLIASDLGAGAHEIAWDGKDAGGRQVASGIYLYRLSAPQGNMVKRMTLLR